MKILKKLLLGTLSLVLLCGAMFTFSGCSEVNGNTYAYDGLTYTIITDLDNQDPTIIKETKTLTSREYWLHKVSDRKVALKDLASATMSEVEENAYRLWLKGEELLSGVSVYTSSSFKFSRKTVEKITVLENEITGEGAKKVKSGTYEENDGIISIEFQTKTAEDNDGESEYEIIRAYAVNEKLEFRAYEITSADGYSEGALFYRSIVYVQK